MEDFSDRFCKGQKLYAELTQDRREGNRTAGDSADRFSAGRTTAAAVIADAVFGVKCIVGMSRTIGSRTSRLIAECVLFVQEEKSVCRSSAPQRRRTRSQPDLPPDVWLYICSDRVCGGSRKAWMSASDRGSPQDTRRSLRRCRRRGIRPRL